MFSNTRFSSASVALLLCCGVLGCAGVGGGAAAEMPGGKLRRSTQVQLEEVDAKLAAQKFDEALALLDGAGQGDLNPYERALLGVKRANVYSATKQYEQAAGALKQSVELQALPEAEQAATSYRLVNLYVGLRRYEDAVALIESAGLPSKGPSSPSSSSAAESG